MLMALTLLSCGVSERKIHLYDTFTGMTPPGRDDVIAWNGLPVADKMAAEQAAGRDSFAGWSVGLEEVRKNLSLIDYPMENLLFIPGDVEKTLSPGVPEETLPETIALLRLDTDWYASTKKELEVLYPRLVSGGFLIIDDYGHFEGARKAVDEYFATLPREKRPYLSRLDYTGRIGVKP